jgi:nucleoside-diphosphate-sugar epimerase
MAFGMRPDSGVFKHYWIGRTHYGIGKRFGERLAATLGSRTGHSVYALRLGQVYGEIQDVSSGLEHSIQDRVAFVPDTPSDTVFAFSIAEGLTSIAQGGEKPGLYSVVSNPQWSWADIHRYYAKRRGLEERIILVSSARPNRRPKFLAARKAVLGTAMRYRETVSAYFLSRMPSIESRAAALYYCYKAKQEVAKLEELSQYVPYRPPVGPVPGQRLAGITDSRITMHAPTCQIREILGAVVPAGSRNG